LREPRRERVFARLDDFDDASAKSAQAQPELLQRTARRAMTGAVVYADRVLEMRGRAFDLATVRLPGTSVATRQTVVIDRATGATTPSGSTGFVVRGRAERRLDRADAAT